MKTKKCALSQACRGEGGADMYNGVSENRTRLYQPSQRSFYAAASLGVFFANTRGHSTATHTLSPSLSPSFPRSLAPCLFPEHSTATLILPPSLPSSLPGTAQTPNPTPYTLSPRPNTRNTPTPYNLRPNPSLHPQRMQATRCPQLVPAATAAGNSTTSPHLPPLSAASPPPRYAHLNWPSPAGSCRPVTARARTVRGNGRACVWIHTHRK